MTSVPEESMSLRLNFWTPDDDFTSAFDAALQPAADASGNETFYFEVDFVEVSRPQV